MTPGAQPPHDRDPHDRHTGEDGAQADPQAAPEQASEEQPSPELIEAIRQLGASGRAGLDAAGETGRAMHALVAADLSLARSALGRALVYAVVAAVFGGTAWLLATATLVVFLSRSLGIAWSLSLLVTTLASALLALLGAWLALRYLKYTRLQATRRQLGRLGIGAAPD